jgi:hypothetical protein
VFDGRYTYSRYFSPKQHNQPRTLEDIFELNDVELFDLEADPDEMQNLATEPKKHGDLLPAMNDKMSRRNGYSSLKAKTGSDDHESPPVAGWRIPWQGMTYIMAFFAKRRMLGVSSNFTSGGSRCVFILFRCWF